ncbi:tetratricopeptide repeat protein [Lyngbya sp. CCAP 1446/10]|uniref:CHAT domain-containing protein n=1 Tax=Lyngbya sp. CCAP 1446/10 TaxID=439293 RepID=UPI002236FA61|nr:tetratricopeptide repeat protein [Lyngbya sp. CCAP 1446/10]MCW6052313.1 tetratricopeptide repeat protein [Lyngbya sp. CCAP 1446/10]
MFDKIWQFLKQLIQRIFGTNRPISTPHQPPTLTDAEFEAKLMELLEGVNAGWGSGDVTEFLLAKRLRDTELADWLRRFGDRLLAIDRETTEEGGHGDTASTDSAASLQELARRLELLSRICGGELGEAAGKVGREILVKFRISSVGEGEGEGEVDGEAEAWKKLGNEQLDKKDYEGAIASFDKALEIKPDHDTAWNNRAVVLYTLEKFEEAIASFDKALAIKPDCELAWNNRGHALRYLGKLEEAIASFDKALEIKPDYHDAWYNRGVALRYSRKLEEAIASFDKALKFKPDKHEAWCNRGIALRYLGKLEEAIASFDKALEFKPDKHEAWCNRGIALDNLGRLEEAIASFDKALEIKPDLHEAWNNRGGVMYNLGKLEEAIASYDKALEIKPDLHEAWINRGFAVESARRYNHLIYEMLQLQFPASPPVTRTISNPNLNRRGYEGIIFTLEAGLQYCQEKTHPEGYGKLHQALGNAHYSQGKIKFDHPYRSQAATSYKKALKTLTKEAFLKLHLEVLQDLIKTLVSVKNTEAAEKLRRDATDLLHRLLTNKNYSQLSEEELADKLVRFEQLTVNILIQSGKLIEALETAEQDKNVCLSWLLNASPIPDYQEETAATVTHAQIQQLLNPTTCAIYWHLSDAALTTFIIKSDGLLSPEDCYTKSPDEFEEWVKKWNQQYADYQDKSKENANKQNHAWRAGMPSNFARLKDILQIAHIEQQLQSNGITNLILIPHRDLHRFPIHALFSSEFVITYLPSAQFGLNLKHRLNSEISRLSPSSDPPKSPLRRGTLNTPVSPDTTGILNTPVSPGTMETLNTLVPPFLRGARGDLASAINDKNSILSIENPDSIIIDENGQRKKLLPLPAAEIESEIICRMFPNPTRRGEDKATLDEVTKLLPQPHNIFHFTGHGSYDFDNPQQSTLYLSDTHRLTVKEIIQLNLSNYKLICLSACETAVTDKQTILAEYVGLISGFMCAGVGCVVSTLWPVESGASTLLMIDFYRRWREGGDSLPVALANSQKWLQSATGEDLATWCQREIDKISENSSELSEDEVSLRRFFKSNRQNLAKMELDQPYQHPYYWAAFTLTGL